MDPITHTFVGAALGETRLGRAGGWARPALVVAANLPDVDAACYFIDPDLALYVRRGWTHGVLAMALSPLLLAALVAGVARLTGSEARIRPGWLMALCYIGVLSHPALDWLNNYGVRLLMPFDGTWFYGDAVFIVDPWLWLLLGGFLFLRHSTGAWALAGWGVFAGLALALIFTVPIVPFAARAIFGGAVSALAILRWRRDVLGAQAGLAGARVVFSLLLAYCIANLAITEYAEGYIRREMVASGQQVEELMAGPVPVVPFRRDVVADVGPGYRYGTFTLLPRPGLELSGRLIPKPPRTDLVERAWRHPDVQGFRNWVRFPWVHIEREGESARVYLLDARYTRSPTTGFGGTVVTLNAQ